MRLRPILLLCIAILVPPLDAQPRRVGILVYSGMEILDFAGPAAVFAAAGQHAKEGQRGFEILTVGRDRAPAVAMSCLDVLPDHDLSSCPKLDVLVIPGGVPRELMNDRNLLAWIAARAAKADVTLSVCTGAFVAAKAGLLDGKEATTHWAALPLLQPRFPKVKTRNERRFVDAGSIVTAAGVSSGIDAALHVVDRLENRDLAFAAARAIRHRWNSSGVAPDGLVGDAKERLRIVQRTLGVGKIEETGGPAIDVHLPLHDGTRLIDIAGPAEVYRTAREGVGYRVLTVGEKEGAVVDCSGVRIRARSGPRERRGAIVVASRGMAGVDESLSIVEKRFGREEAERTARTIEYPWHDMVAKAERIRVTREVKEQNAAMSAAFKRGDMKAVAAFYADNAVLISASGHRVEGREAVDAYWTRITDGHEWKLEVKSVEGRKGMCIQRGKSTLVRKNDDGTLREGIVEFMLVWVRGKDGRLRITMDAYW
ncbi:MAG: hypothetical protein CL908_18800 [Deltaproteobacteria bacterium]|nr:hypothetical protein [Deltaproteobacteria bacterium]